MGFSAMYMSFSGSCTWVSWVVVHGFLGREVVFIIANCTAIQTLAWLCNESQVLAMAAFSPLVPCGVGPHHLVYVCYSQMGEL